MWSYYVNRHWAVSLSSSATWIRIGNSTGSNGQHLSYSVDANTTSTTRTGTITIGSITITIIQEASPTSANTDGFMLTVTKTGTGSGTVFGTGGPFGTYAISCGSDCSEKYYYSPSITLTANPSTGSTFSGWSGACSGTDTTCTLTVDSAKSVTANFSGVSTNTSTAQYDCLFNWAEDRYPSYFQPSRPTSRSVSTYYYRYYSGTDSYLGVSTGTAPQLYFVAPGAGLARIVDLGAASQWVSQAGCTQ